MSYKIGSFNMHNIGASALSDKNARDLKTIAKIINKEGFDVIALQEVLGEGKAFVSPDYAKRCIIHELGGDLLGQILIMVQIITMIRDRLQGLIQEAKDMHLYGISGNYGFAQQML